jgi:hypothetical protein
MSTRIWLSRPAVPQTHFLLRSDPEPFRVLRVEWVLLGTMRDQRTGWAVYDPVGGEAVGPAISMAQT